MSGSCSRGSPENRSHRRLQNPAPQSGASPSYEGNPRDNTNRCGLTLGFRSVVDTDKKSHELWLQDGQIARDSGEPNSGHLLEITIRELSRFARIFPAAGVPLFPIQS